MHFPIETPHDAGGSSIPPFCVIMKTIEPRTARRNRPPDPDETQRYTGPPISSQDPDVFNEPDSVQAPEVPDGMEELSAWDEPPTATGTRVHSVPPEDENQAIGLVSEGIEEADRELRLAANTENEDEPADTEADYPRDGILS
jgi:hypothetical protein